MRKIKTIATCMLLGTAMVLSAVTPAVAADPATTGEEESDILMIYENEGYEITGKFSRSEPKKVTRIRVEKTSQIIVSSGQSECDVVIRFRDENGVIIRDIFLEPGASWSIYLLAGTYDMSLGYSENGKVRFPRTEKAYSITYYEVACGDTFEETVDAQDGTMETANKIILGSITKCGSIAENESKVDIYQFHSYYDDVPVKIHLTSRISADCELSWSVYTPEALTCLEHGDIAGTEAITGGDLIYEEDQPNSLYVHKEVLLPKGTYYLVISSESDGTYFFEVDQKLSKGIEEFDDIRVPVGASFDLNSEKDGVRYSLTWEAENPSMVSFEDSTGPNSAHAEKAGSTWVTGRGTKTTLSTGSTQNAYVEFWLKVEFTDVIDQKTYYYPPVYWAVRKGITEGYKDKDGYYSKFKPQNDCTRAQILTFLWRMKGSPEPVTLTDYPDVKETDYFYKAVSWAQENGITKGYPDGTFKPGNVCSRSQIVTFLWRLDGEPEPKYSRYFKDVQDTETYYYKAVCWAKENRIAEGYKGGTFRPANKCTRSQAVTFLYRYADDYLMNKDWNENGSDDA